MRKKDANITTNSQCCQGNPACTTGKKCEQKSCKGRYQNGIINRDSTYFRRRVQENASILPARNKAALLKNLPWFGNTIEVGIKNLRTVHKNIEKEISHNK